MAGIGAGRRIAGVDDELRGQLLATREGLTARLNTMQDELRAAWKQWDSGDSEATAVMVDVLNAATGMNNSTQKKFKQFVLSRKFDSGFSLDLLVEGLDCGACAGRRQSPDDFPRP